VDQALSRTNSPAADFNRAQFLAGLAYQTGRAVSPETPVFRICTQAGCDPSRCNVA
jgi:hypothetical protein